MSSKVCLIRPSKLMVKDSIPVDPLPPLGLALLAGVLREKGHEITAIDALALCPEKQSEIEIPYTSEKKYQTNLVTLGLTFDEIVGLIPQDVQIIGISSMFSLNWPADRHLMHLLSKTFPNALLVAGGESIAGMPELCLAQVPALKVCVLGEGEETIVELVQALENGSDLNTVPGLMFKDDDGAILKTEKRQRIRQLDHLPLPAWDLFPVGKYKRHPVVKGEVPRITLPILATRGCPYECTFCTSPDMWGTRYFMRKPEKVMEEILWLYHEYGVTNIEFYDLTAIIRKEWIIEFAKIKMAHGLDITWKIPAGTRSEAIDDEVAMYLKKSGCYFITYAPESGSPRMLQLIKKKVNLDNMLLSMGYSHEKGMITFINMILALPDETHKDVWRTLRFLTKCAKAGVSDLALAVFRPYPGSELFNRLITEKKVSFESDDYFIESLLIIDTGYTGTIFNANISPFWYGAYRIAAYLAFYGAGYLYKPASFFRAIRNIFYNQTNSLFEYKIAFKLKQWAEPFKFYRFMKKSAG